MQALLENRSPSLEEYHTFREIRKKAGSSGTYQKRLFVMMGCYWITASFFLILPFYFFKTPIYCTDPQTEGSTCTQCTGDCQQQLCMLPMQTVRLYVKPENTLTDQFSLYCERDSWRFAYKVEIR